MSFRPALLIPNYNHGGALPATVAGLQRFGLPILIVDDGSGADDQRVLDQLQGQPNLFIERLPVNRGKGAASMHGFRWLQAQGYSHAFQIDADGQHDQQVVPQFLAAAAAAPTALIGGKPVYDASIPKARLYGRKITDFWVALETLSFDIEDAMCGFRIYPLAATCALIDRVRIGARMDFDIEILVRLYWAGMPVQFLPLAVTYPQDGVSHFKALRDNLMISRCHTALFVGMFPRAPLLLWRKLQRWLRPAPTKPKALSAQVNESHWSQQQERGSTAGIAILVFAYRMCGRRVFSALLYPVMLYFVLFNRTARQASQQFLQRVHQTGSAALPTPPGWRDSFRHLRSFAEAMLDKIAAWRGEISAADVQFDQQALLQQVKASGRGALLIGSHLGNLELARALSTRADAPPVTAVVFTEHGQRFMNYLKQQHPDVAAQLLEVADMGADTAMLLRERIDRGELLVIVGDRTPVHSQGRIQMQPFLGAPAAFAHGPFVLASLLDCPVYLFFCLREGKRFRLTLEPFATSLACERSARAEMLVEATARYAERLGHYARQAPLQWFNFFDFWQKPKQGV